MTATVDPPAGGRVVAFEERHLLMRHRRGDRGAFAELVARYKAPVYGYLVRSGVAPADRDDQFQDIFLKVHRGAASFRADRPLHPWIFTIVANTVRNYLRGRRVRDRVFSEPTGGGSPAATDIGSSAPEPVDPAADAERASDARQTVGWLEQRITSLPTEQREVLLLSCIEELPLAQIANLLDIPLNTVKSRLRRARLALAKALAKRRQSPADQEES